MLLAPLALLLAAAGLTAGAPTKRADLNPYPDGRRLTFGPDGKFKLVHFTDLHFAERGLFYEYWAPGDERGHKSVGVMDGVLADEHPNFIVYGGDQINGEHALYDNVTTYLDWAYSPALKSNTPFASVYGNHDESYNISHLISFEYETQRAPARHLSWTQRNPESSPDPRGAFNYYIPVYANAGATTPSLLLWFFDSRSGVFSSGKFLIIDEPWMTEDWVHQQSAKWLNETADAMKAAWGKLPKSLAFVHIPPTAALTIQTNEVTPKLAEHPGIHEEPTTNQGRKAGYWKSVGDGPFWQAVSGTLGGTDGQGLIALTAGHDHLNDWCGRTPAVGPYTYCYGRHTGYGGYGDLPRGSRVFEARLGNNGALANVRSWIRLADHTSQNTNLLVVDGNTTLVNTKDPAPAS
ncbi:putative inactive purple acid phosphatase 16 [Vanrija pseudolonga]|uniref:Inactive purple acid phosphatase 16 n=1 Tax=Vanrija pseudolonga TaxID=143232 RepID=A0AAF0Y4D4_9TREE|nr:putative inactive purple acid phosphatase 16 [Vanrija pseudolonga]